MMQSPQICRGRWTRMPQTLTEMGHSHCPPHSPPSILSLEYCSTGGFQAHKTSANESPWQVLTVLHHSTDVKWPDRLPREMKSGMGGGGEEEERSYNGEGRQGVTRKGDVIVCLHRAMWTDWWTTAALTDLHIFYDCFTECRSLVPGLWYLL